MQVVPFDGDFSPMFKQEIMDVAEVAQHVNVFQLPGNPSGSWAALTQHADLPSTPQAQSSPKYCECDTEDESDNCDDSGDESDETDFDLGFSSPMEEGQLPESPLARFAQSASAAGGSQLMAHAQASAMGWDNNANLLPPGAPRPRSVVPAWMADPAHPANQAFEVMRNLPVLPMAGGDMTRREPPRAPPAPPAAAQGGPLGSYGLRGGRGPATYYGPVEIAQQPPAEPRMSMPYNRHPVPNQQFHSGVAVPTSVANPGIGPGMAPQAQYPPQPNSNHDWRSYLIAMYNAQAHNRGHPMQVQTMNNPDFAAPVGWAAQDQSQSQGHLQPDPQVHGNIYYPFANQVPGQSQTVTRSQTSYENGAIQRVETRSLQVMGGPGSLPPPAPGMHRRVTVKTTVTDYHPAQGGMPHPMQ